MKDDGIAGRVAFVGGGASGIGLAIAHQLGDRGARVIVADIDGDAADTAAVAVSGRGIALDVADADAVAAAFADIAATEGSVTLAVNCAGVAGTGQATRDYAPDAWRALHAVNLDGVFHSMQQQLRHMADAGGGSIVNIASVLALVGWPNNAAYVAAKHALIGLTRTAAVENAAAGIRINALCPGFIDTPLLRSRVPQDRIGAIVARHPIGRIGRSEEVADFALFLLSHRASFVTGAALPVDGGFTAQ